MMKDCLLSLLMVTLVVLGCELVSPQFFFNDDAQAAHIPGCLEVARIWRSGHIPWLSDCSWSTRGLASEYQFAIFNPLVQLAILGLSAFSDLAWGTAAFVWFLSWLGAWGCLTLGRSYGLDRCMSLAFALLYCFNRYNLCVGWRAWLPMAVSSVWLPWFWAACRDPRLVPWRYVFCLSLVLSSGWPFTVLACGSLIAYHLALAAWARDRSRFLGLLALSLCGACLGAVSLTMLSEYARGGFRLKGLSWIYTLDPESFLSYLLPGLSLYSPRWAQVNLNLNIGWIPCLGILGVVLQRFRGQAHPALWGLAICWYLLGVLPSAAGFRISSRWLLYLNPVMGLIGLLWLKQKAAEPEHRFRGLTWLALLAAQLLGPLLSLLRSLPVVTNWPAGVLLWIWCLGWNRLPPARRPGWVLAGVIAGLFLATPPTFLSQRQYPYRRVWVGRVVEPERSYLSLFSLWELASADPKLVVPTRFGNLAMGEGLHLVNGYSPIFAAPIMWSLHLSNMGSLEPDDNGVSVVAQAVTRGNLLEKLGVNGLLISPAWRPLDPLLKANGWRLQGSEGQVEVWHRGPPTNGPVGESLTEARLVTSLSAATASLLEGSNADVLLKVDGAGLQSYAPLTCKPVSQDRNGVVLDLAANDGDRPGLIAVRLPWVAGFRAFLNGQELPLQTLNIQHIGVEIPAHSPPGRLEVVYSPRSLGLGLGLALAGVLGAVALSHPRLRFF